MTMTMSETVTRLTAFAAALLLVLSMIALVALSDQSGTEMGSVIPAAADTEHADQDHRDDKPENNPNPEEPPCDADHGHPGANAPQCDDEDHPGNNGDKPSDPGDDEQTPQEECEDEGGTWNEDTQECEFDGSDPQQECEDEGGTWNEDTQECEFDEPEGERCGSGDGLDLTENGTIGQEMYNNDPTGLANDPDAGGPISQPLYDESQDTGLDPLTEEAACVANLATL